MISLGREVLGDLNAATRREWLVTNGIGGFASGTVAGMNTRRYHGLLFAALNPPLGRKMVLAQLDEEATLNGRTHALATNEWAGGTVTPRGHTLLESFHLEGSTPVFTYALADALLQKRIWMAHGANTTYVTYSLVRGRHPVRMSLTPVVGLRDYHSHHTGATLQPRLEPVAHGVRVSFYPDALPYWLKIDRGAFHLDPLWYWNYYHRVEDYRGLDTIEDLLSPGRFSVELAPGDTLTFLATLHHDAELDGAIGYQAEWVRQAALLTRANLENQPGWVEQLVLTADQFIVDRPIASQGLEAGAQEREIGQSIIAGYHWFGDWGRDTMISLPGLTLSTGRPGVAARILRTFAHHVDQGMLPNRFPDIGATPEYNTADATLWYFDAIHRFDRYLSENAEEGDNLTGARDRDLVTDLNLVGDLYPTLVDIMSGIGAAPATGSKWMGRMGCCGLAHRACNRPGWTPKWATGW